MLLGGIDWLTFNDWRSKADIPVAEKDHIDRRRKLYTRAQLQQIADQHGVTLAEDSAALTTAGTPNLKALAAQLDELMDLHLQLREEVNHVLGVIRHAQTPPVGAFARPASSTHRTSGFPDVRTADEGEPSVFRAATPRGASSAASERPEGRAAGALATPTADGSTDSVYGRRDLPIAERDAPWSGSTPSSPFSSPSFAQSFPLRRPVGGRKTRPLATVPDPRDLRTYWVGRGDTQEYFALFIYCQQAHGVKDSTAGTQAITAKKRLSEGREPQYFLTTVQLARGEERRIVTREQAIQNIKRLHEQARDRYATREIPERARCLDPECPVCATFFSDPTGGRDVMSPVPHLTGDTEANTEE